MPLFRLFLMTIALIAASPTAWAWGPSGHRIVATLAERQLRPAARAEVDRLLAGEPEPTLAGVANWADDLRKAEAGSRRSNARWHFVNFKGDCNLVPARDCPDGDCVIGAIDRNLLALADRARPDSERRDALKFLVHLVGDVHQPLHASSRDDRGGNDFQISYHGQGTNLHAVWDTLILQRAGLTPEAEADALFRQSPLPPDPTRRSARRAVDWAVESCRLITAAKLYPPTHVIDDAYLDRHRPVAETRLRQAGNRLADVINLALATPVPPAN